MPSLKVKLTIIALAAIAVSGVLLYTPITNAIQQTNSEHPNAQCPHTPKCRPCLKAMAIWWFLNHSELIEVQGEAVVMVGDKMVIETTEEQVRVHLPEDWILEGEPITREELFESGYITAGETLSITALSADIIDKNSLRIYLAVGYEITDESNVTAYAMLPVNIET